jgi:hypothetical protein
MTSFELRNCMLTEETFTLIMMGLEPPLNSDPPHSTRSHIFHQMAATHGSTLAAAVTQHVPSHTSAKNKNNTENNTENTSKMTRFIIANVPLGGSYDFGHLLDANFMLEEVALCCVEMGGLRDALHFTSKGKRLGIGDVFTVSNRTIKTLIESLQRNAQQRNQVRYTNNIGYQ